MRIPRVAPRWRRGAALAVAMLAALPGCGSSPAQPPPDRDAAKEVLERSLRSWQEGETIDGLRDAGRPIIVSDPAWERGDRLTGFVLAGPGRPRGDQQSFDVTLWLTDARKRQTKVMAEYRVSISPAETVTRSVFD